MSEAKMIAEKIVKEHPEACFLMRTLLVELARQGKAKSVHEEIDTVALSEMEETVSNTLVNLAMSDATPIEFDYFATIMSGFFTELADAGFDVKDVDDVVDGQCVKCKGDLRKDGYCKSDACYFADWPQSIGLAAAITGQADVALKRIEISARVKTDDDAEEAQFDAGPYFYDALQQGTLERVVTNLSKTGFGGDYPADAVAEFFRDDETKNVFEHVEAYSEGFECYLDVDDGCLYHWLSRYAPETDLLKQANEGKL